jgi:hypothetical protein
MTERQEEAIESLVGRYGSDMASTNVFSPEEAGGSVLGLPADWVSVVVLKKGCRIATAVLDDVRLSAGVSPEGRVCT